MKIRGLRDSFQVFNSILRRPGSGEITFLELQVWQSLPSHPVAQSQRLVSANLDFCLGMSTSLVRRSKQSLGACAGLAPAARPQRGRRGECQAWLQVGAGQEHAGGAELWGLCADIRLVCQHTANDGSQGGEGKG